MSEQENRKQYAQVQKDITILTNKMSLIKSRYMKDIWMDSTYDCDRKDTLRNAELTLRLADNTEYQSMLEKLWDLEAQQIELGHNLFEL